MANEGNGNGGKAYEKDERWIKGKLEDHANELANLEQAQQKMSTELTVLGTILPEIRSGIEALKEKSDELHDGISDIRSNLMTKEACELRHNQLKNDFANFATAQDNAVIKSNEPEGGYKSFSNNGFLQTIITAILVGSLSFGAFKCYAPGGWSCEGQDLKKSHGEVTAAAAEEETPEGAHN